ncbi:MAG: Hpt domain-containing protein [Lentisphaerae bacterium]|nr:MAG: Hpt domain-containing protein [Lentisphaerota bacterium]
MRSMQTKEKFEATYQSQHIADLDRIREVLDGVSKDFYSTLVDTFQSHATKESYKILKAYLKGDYETIRQSAHSIKGAALNIGAARLAWLTLQLETAAKEHDNHLIDKILPHLRHALSEFIQFIKEKLNTDDGNLPDDEDGSVLD